jgi:hypothetical protein
MRKHADNVYIVTGHKPTCFIYPETTSLNRSVYAMSCTTKGSTKITIFISPHYNVQGRTANTIMKPKLIIIIFTCTPNCFHHSHENYAWGTKLVGKFIGHFLINAVPGLLHCVHVSTATRSTLLLPGAPKLEGKQFNWLPFKLQLNIVQGLL